MSLTAAHHATQAHTNRQGILSHGFSLEFAPELLSFPAIAAMSGELRMEQVVIKRGFRPPIFERPGAAFRVGVHIVIIGRQGGITKATEA